MGGELLILIVVLTAISIPVGVLYLLVRVAALSRRLARAEARLLTLTERTATAERVGTGPAVPEAVQGPWQSLAKADAAPPAPLPETRPPLPKPDLHRPDWRARTVDWLAANWFYVVAAASLALAGVFLIQYGAEQGLLPPSVRVAAAVLFGSGLIAAGEWLRRRWGDGPQVVTAHLPSVSSGAGIVTLFAALLGARHLYDLIGPNMSLLGLATIAVVAIALGWFHGPLLIAVGLVGGAVAPFIVGGASQDVAGLHAYFTVLGLAGLMVDAVRRWPWRWVSLLSLAAGFGGSAVLAAAAPHTVAAHLFAVTALTLATLALSVGRLWPDHRGAMLGEALLARRSGLVRPATLLSGFAVAAGCAAVIVAAEVAFWWSMAVATVLIGALSIWAHRARALQDLTLLPLGAMLACIALTDTGTRAEALWVLAIGGVAAGLAAWRSLSAGDRTHPVGWALAATVMAPAVGLTLHLTWAAPDLIGAWGWSIAAMIVAAGLTGLAGIWAARDGLDRLRPSLAAVMAFTVIAYGLAQIVGEAALTGAIAIMAAVAAMLDRSFRLPLLVWFVVLGAPFTAWRLLGVPGWGWALDAPLTPVVLSFGTAIIGFGVAWHLLRGRDRTTGEVVAETASLSFVGLAAILALWRGAVAFDGATPHLVTGLAGSIWILLGWVQLRRAGAIVALRRVRMALGWVFAGLGGLLMLVVLTVLNPLLADLFSGVVRGPIIVNSLAAAYLLPGALLMLYPGRVARMLGVALGGVWLALVIRHFWNGAAGMPLSEGASQAEITTYTVALLLVGGGVFYHGIAARADGWRRAGVGLLGLTAAKVFVVDAASLTGLLRVGAFVALALCLAGLAWLNRWAGGARSESSSPETAED
ncbi:DUF2339 domain-containing protein [Jannaschia sp. 2305UL9-9]|uniref:DUF2339 domain-containing protein n=1 Tax=Jannaschia sp. 2305UL9-9 TaxID=3121638 RepID=UPI003529BC78